MCILLPSTPSTNKELTNLQLVTPNKFTTPRKLKENLLKVNENEALFAEPESNTLTEKVKKMKPKNKKKKKVTESVNNTEEAVEVTSHSQDIEPLSSNSENVVKVSCL